MDTLGKVLLLFEMQNMRQRETRIKTSGQHLSVLSHLFLTDVAKKCIPCCFGYFFLFSRFCFIKYCEIIKIIREEREHETKEAQLT